MYKKKIAFQDYKFRSKWLQVYRRTAYRFCNKHRGAGTGGAGGAIAPPIFPNLVLTYP